MKTFPCAHCHLSPVDNGHGVVRVSDPYETELSTMSLSLKCARARSTRSIDSLSPLRFGSDFLLTGLMQVAQPVITSHGNSGHHVKTASRISQQSSKRRRRHLPGA